MEIIAHRGASFDAPENTLASVKLAWEQKADAVEVDVHLSKDGSIVVIHDPNTSKVAGIRKRVSEQTLAELKALDVGSWKNPKWADERISTLAEMLASIPKSKRLFIEIKCGADIVPEFKKVVRSSGHPPNQIIAIGFALETMRQIKKILPEIEVCWIAEFKRDWKTGGWRPKPETLIQKAKEAGLDGLDLGAKGPITSKLVEQIKEAKLKFYLWTVDSPAKARKFLAAGVDGITANRPAWLREQLGG